MNRYKYTCRVCLKRKVRTKGSRCRVCRSWKAKRITSTFDDLKERETKKEIKKIDQHLLTLHRTKTKHPRAMKETIDYWVQRRLTLKNLLNASNRNT